MIRMKTTPTRAIIALLIAALLAGCASFSLEPPAPTEKHIIVLWHALTGTESEALQALTDRFNDENAQDIVLVTEYQEDILTKLEDSAPENHPDLVIVWPKDLQAYIRNGLIGAAPALSPDVRRERADLLPMAEALYTVNGTMQALPLGLVTYLMYYNVDWLGDLGYDPATATWEDLHRTACAATDPLRGQMGLGMPAHASALLALLASGGSEIIGADGYYNFADAAGIQTANTINEILGGDCGVVYDDLGEGTVRLSHSSLSMMVESSMRLMEIEQAVAEGRNFRLDVSALPGPAGPGPTLWYGPGMVVIAPEGTRRDAALSVLGWFFSVDAQTDWSATTDYLPVRRSLIETRLDEEIPPIEESLLHATLSAADDATWVAWPRYTNRVACRASLLRGLLSLKEGTLDPGAYIGIAVTACNTGVRP